MQKNILNFNFRATWALQTSEKKVWRVHPGCQCPLTLIGLNGSRTNFTVPARSKHDLGASEQNMHTAVSLGKRTESVPPLKQTANERKENFAWTWNFLKIPILTRKKSYFIYQTMIKCHKIFCFNGGWWYT